MEEQKTSKKKTIILSVTAGVIVVGLGLGLGLGFGLREHDGEKDDTDKHAAFTVTEAEWENAFDFSDKNCTVKISWSMPNDSEADGEMFVYMIGDGNAFLNMDGVWQSGTAQSFSKDLNEGYMFFANQAFGYFTYHKATNSYKSTGSWYGYIAEKNGWLEEGGEAEDFMQLEGEVKFQDKKLVSCAVTLNPSESSSEKVTYTVTVTGYGNTVKPAEAPENE